VRKLLLLYLVVIRSALYYTFALHFLFKNHYLMRCDKTYNSQLGRGDMLNISALGNLMLPRGLLLPRADIINSVPTSCYLYNVTQR